MADYADLLAAEARKKEEIKNPSNESVDPKPTPLPTSQSTNQSTEQLTAQKRKQKINKQVDQSVSQSTSRPINRQIVNNNKIVDRPKAFYITERLDRKLDDAVRYLQEVHEIKKADRSTIVNAILDNDAYWTDEALDLLVDRVISQLTSRLTGK